MDYIKNILKLMQGNFQIKLNKEMFFINLLILVLLITIIHFIISRHL